MSVPFAPTTKAVPVVPKATPKSESHGPATAESPLSPATTADPAKTHDRSRIAALADTTKAFSEPANLLLYRFTRRNFDYRSNLRNAKRRTIKNVLSLSSAGPSPPLKI